MSQIPTDKLRTALPNMIEKIALKDIGKKRPLAGNHEIRRSTERMLQKGTKTKSPAQLAAQRLEQQEWNKRQGKA